MKRQDITILSLSASAVILLVLVVLIQWFNSPQVVIAGSMEARGGDYVATMGQIASDVEALYLLDARSRTLGIYSFDNNTKRVELLTSFPIMEVEQFSPR